MSSKLKLDDEQKVKLEEFRKNLSDVLKPQHDDYFLTRWLKARSWNLQAAEKMLRESLNWREQFQVDTIENWKAPDVLLEYMPSGCSGYDKDGAPIIITPLAEYDIYGLMHAGTRNDLIKVVIQMIENNMKLAQATGAREIVAIFDMDNFSIKPYTWRPASELMASFLQIYEANYPEFLKVCYIVNAPTVFAIAFNFIKRFLHEATINKMHIYKNDPKKWKKVLLENIEPDNLPAYYGGTLTDPDGNPKLHTKVKPGGKVPPEKYLKSLKFNEDDLTKPLQTLSIKRGDKSVLEFQVSEPGSVLKWDFQTEGHDIRFGITARDAMGNLTPVVRFRRITANEINESGSILCQAPATYLVTFDNSYSYLRSKVIKYIIEILPKDFENVEDNLKKANGDLKSLDFKENAFISGEMDKKLKISNTKEIAT